MTTRWWTAPLAVLLTALVATASYSGSITVSALLLGVVPGVVLAGVSTALATRIGRALTAALVGLLVALAWAELVNLITGQGNGPAARSTFAAAGCSALAVAAAAWRWPALFLVGVAGVVVGALALGAGAEVQAVAVVTAVVSVFALAVIESGRRRWAGPGTGRLAVVVVALLCGAAAVVVWITLTHRVEPTPYVVSSIVGEPAIRPPGSGPQATPSPTTTTTTPARMPTTRPPTGSMSPASSAPTSEAASAPTTETDAPSVLAGVLVVLLALAVLLALVALRVLWVALVWRRLRRRLRRGPPEAALTGAWVWAGYRLRAREVALPMSLSPDAISSDSGSTISNVATVQVPRRVARPLGDVAALAVTAAFAATPGHTTQQVDDAWRSADRAASAALDGLNPFKRLRVRLAMPARDLRH